MSLRKALYAALGTSIVVLSTHASAQDAGPVGGAGQDPGSGRRTADTGYGEIVVTAQKREQSINSVGMTISAFTNETLAQRDITNVADLVRIVPGFTFTQASTMVPVYTLRGVGLYDSGLASSPAVSVYVDEVPFTVPIMTTGSSLDLERIEVLKGPQGILFGQNSTGGAINYIAAKPTSVFKAGGSVGVDNFGKIDAQGFVSGPVSSTLNARIAVRGVTGGAWQRSITRPKDRLGDTDLLIGRLLLDWRPTDRLTIAVNLNANRDKSDTQAPQVTALCPGTCDPTSQYTPLILAQSLSPDRPRAADWSPDQPMSSDNSYWQASVRGDYEIADDITITSITAYQRQKVSTYFDNDGTPLSIFHNRVQGQIKGFNQEFRLAGDTGSLNWLLGGSYEHIDSSDYQQFLTYQYSRNIVFPDIPAYDGARVSVLNKTNTYAAFANAEFRLSDNFTVRGGLRYTKSNQSSISCSADIPGEHNELGLVFVRLQEIYTSLGIKTTPIAPIPNGQCYTLNADFLPGPLPQKLTEDNVSFRVGADYKTDSGTLFYGTVSRGYKSGVFTNISASTTAQYFPAVQERVDAYEVGLKAPLFDRRAQFNAAAFYYNYKNKQVRGRVIDPIWGPVERLVNVPKSRVWGIEAELQASPFEGLTLSGSATYLNSRVNDDFDNYNAAGTPGNFRGSDLPYTPKWQAAADAEYSWPMAGSDIRPFVGGSLTYHSDDQATFDLDGQSQEGYDLPAYTLLDARLGIRGGDDRWSASLWARNLTNKFYVVSIFETTDSRFRYAGRPRTFGVTFSLKTR